MKKFLFLLLLLGACSDSAVTMTEPSELKHGDQILDVRTVDEHEKAALALEHWLVPLDQLNVTEFISEHKPDTSKTLYILCRSGARAILAAKQFKKAGFQRVAVIRGGIIAAEKSGLKIKKEAQK